MTRLGLIVRLLFGALVNTLFILALMAAAAIVLLWIIGRNMQLQERRQRRYGANASPQAEERRAGLWSDPPTPFGSILSPTQDVPPRRLSFSTGQGGPAFGAQTGVAAAPQEAPGVTARASVSTPVAADAFAGHGRSDAGRTTPGSSARRVSFLLTPEQERRVSTGGSLWNSGDGSERVPSSPRVVVTRLAGQPTGENMATAAAVTAAETRRDGGLGARVDSGSRPVSEGAPMDTRAPTSTPRSSRKGGKGGLTQRRTHFGGEVARRPISKKSQAAVFSSLAWTAGGGSSGPLSRKQLDSRLFTSVSLRSKTLAGAAGDGREGRSGAHDSDAVGGGGDIGVVCEDSTESVARGDADGGSRAHARDASGADSSDNGDDVDQDLMYPSDDQPQLHAVDASSAASAATTAPPSRSTATNSRLRKTLAGSIRKTSSSTTAMAVAAGRRARFIRGSPPGTQPVPMPYSVSSAGALPDTAGMSSPTTVAWERSRRAAAARVTRMLADADAAEAAASAVASQSEAHSRAAAAAESAAASVRAQAAAEEAELQAQQREPVGKGSRSQARRCSHILRPTGCRRGRRHHRRRRSAPLNVRKEPSVGSCTSNLLGRIMVLVHLPRRCSSSWTRPGSSASLDKGRLQPAMIRRG
eukprot:TRINITY_DN1178_c0_g1_i7.p1 TRINITY_DN1178_c0_g1~~TRINITY_DN1178_c0_g1_i7.p1  ORF type:complete len:642 (-),score=76.64 TRINITY_DN1178_c0_g1_i7:1371-3296(-)